MVKLDEPLRRLDAMTARTISAIRNKREHLRTSMVESVQTGLDHVEKYLDKVMLPAEGDAAKYSDDTTVIVTVKRVADMTYRLNFGIVKYSVDLVKSATDDWVVIMEKTFHPRKVVNRSVQ